jgi:hypothetical protein
MIYSKTQPAEVVQLLMEALKLSISEDSSSSGAGGARGQGQMRSNAILEEIDTDSQESAAAEKGNDQQAASSSSSPGAKSYVDVDYPGLATGAAA